MWGLFCKSAIFVTPTPITCGFGWLCIELCNCIIQLFCPYYLPTFVNTWPWQRRLLMFIHLGNTNNNRELFPHPMLILHDKSQVITTHSEVDMDVCTKSHGSNLSWPSVLVILYLKEDGHGSNDASFPDGSTEAVKVIWIVKVDLHLWWETEHKQLEEWTRRTNSPVINHLDTLLRSWWKAVLRGIKEGVFITLINLP